MSQTASGAAKAAPEKSERTAARPGEKALAVANKPVHAMQPAELAEYCHACPDEAARTIQALLTKNTGDLPGTLFVQRDGEGLLKRVRIGVTLRESKKHLVNMWTGQGKTWEITANGFRELNTVAGLHIITPSEVVVNNQRQPNPFVEIDPATRTPLVVFTRKVVVGPSQITGSMTVTDVMLRFDLGTYLIESIISKAKGLKEAVRNFMLYGGPEDKPKPEGGPANARWKYMPVLGQGFQVGIWVNVAHDDFAAVMSNHVTKMKFAERVAQTIAERNALKSHPGMTTSVLAQNGIGIVHMLAWHQATSRAELDELRKRIDADTLRDRTDVEVIRVDVDAGASAVDHADADEAAEDAQRTAGQVEEPERREPSEPGDARLPPDQMARKVAEAMEAAATLSEAIGSKKMKAKMAEIGIEGEISEATAEQLDRLIGLAAGR